MPKSQDYLERLRGLVASLLGPGVPSAQSAPMGQAAPQPIQMVMPQQQMAPQPVLGAMQARLQALNQAGGNNMGGMFDIIYRKRKEREDALRDLGAQ